MIILDLLLLLLLNGHKVGEHGLYTRNTYIFEVIHKKTRHVYAHVETPLAYYAENYLSTINFIEAYISLVTLQKGNLSC